MATVMHIGRETFTGKLKTLCGKSFPPGEGGAPRNAPMCRKCVRRAGWTHDEHH